MPFSVEGLTVEDFMGSSWHAILEGVDERDCQGYRAAFYTKSDEAHAVGDDNTKNLFAMLGDISSMFIDSDDHADPLKPMWQMGGRRSAIPSDFDDALPLLADILPHIDNAELKARVADVLWLRKRDYKAAREAVTAYLDAARLEDGESWPDAVSRIERAIDIAARANQRDLLDVAVQRIEASLDGFTGTEATFLPVRLMQILQGREAGDPVKYAVLAESLAVAAEGRGNWHMAREYWDVQSTWYRVAKDEEKVRTARLRSAETFVQEGESKIDIPNGEGFMVAAHFLERAIHSLRTVGDQRERISELHRHLLEYQRLAVSEAKSISVPFDPSDMIAHATEAVAGQDLYSAIFALSLLGRSPHLTTLRHQAELQRRNSLRSFIPMDFKNAMGRTVARTGTREDDETQEEADLRIEMYQVASMGQLIHVQGFILPARAQVLREHDVRVADLRLIVYNNPFVPPGREEFYARGLHAGFSGDFTVAVHLLVPQIEHSIRYILEQLDVLTSGLDHQGIQEEFDLNRTLKKQFAESLARVLGEDLVFDLRGLLVEKGGANVRNEMAHGLMDYEAFTSVPCIYLWWLVLHMCCRPVITALQANEEGKNSLGEGDDASEETS